MHEEHYAFMYRSWIAFLDLYLYHGWDIEAIRLDPGEAPALNREQEFWVARVCRACACRREQTDDGHAGMQRFCLHGPPGTGKSFAIDALLARLQAFGERILMVTPTGVLADVYRQAHRTHTKITVDTFDGGFAYGHDAEVAAWRVSSFPVWVIDEIFFLSKKHWCWLLHLHDVCNRRPTVVVVGDTAQLSPFPDRIADHDVDAAGFSETTLRTVLRSRDAALLRLQQFLRTEIPTSQQLRQLVGDRLLHPVLREAVCRFAARFPGGLMLAVTRDAVWNLNAIAIDRLFRDRQAMASIMVDYYGMAKRLDLFEGMNVMITRNMNKSAGLVNRACGQVIHAQRDLVMVQLHDHRVLPVHKLSYSVGDETFVAYPLTAAYACTVAKAQGRTVDVAGVWLDVAAPGAGYVAVSRVRNLANLWWLVAPSARDLVPFRLS